MRALLPLTTALCLALAPMAPAQSAVDIYEKAAAAYKAGDLDTAFAGYLVAAHAGLDLAQYNVATYFRDGLGSVPAEGAKAEHWFKLAAAQGNAMAAESLAMMYHYGNHIPQDATAARRYMQQAAEGGRVVAQYNFGVFLRHGMGGPTDLQGAVPWLEKAAAADYTDAWLVLGDLHFNDLKDYASGYRYYEEAAKRDQPRGYHILGQMFFYGEGKPQDDIRAWVWFAFADGNGQPKARGFLDQLQARMTKSDFDAANALADQCFESGEYTPCL
ncbi:tetratricopeptide repeat protein [Thalassovita sp.]|uniref:tetratricopeptide repeat protein n=1 Tax=Thalassovita sp. TaxID=1979401 RepID=UPI0029DE7059|nr:tetratricopeptide repeat protein [Thalassovita sp.]